MAARMKTGGIAMENLGELIWFAAYLIQMIALLVGIGFVGAGVVATLYKFIWRKVQAGRLIAPTGVLKHVGEA
jgi:hypothetical protein